MTFVAMITDKYMSSLTTNCLCNNRAKKIKWSVYPSYVFQAAKETGALQEAKEKLEIQVKELTLQLELEKRQRVIYLSLYI